MVRGWPPSSVTVGVQVGDLAQAVTAAARASWPTCRPRSTRRCRSAPASSGIAGRRRARPSPGSTPGRCTGPPGRRPIWCRVRPSRASNADPHRPALPAAATLPSRLKLGPSGWVISIGRSVVRCGPRTASVVVVAGLCGDRQLELVGDLEDLLLDQVDVGRDAVDRVGPGQVVLVEPGRTRARAPSAARSSSAWPERARRDRAVPGSWLMSCRPRRAQGRRASPGSALTISSTSAKSPSRIGIWPSAAVSSVRAADHAAVRSARPPRRSTRRWRC